MHGGLGASKVSSLNLMGEEMNIGHTLMIKIVKQLYGIPGTNKIAGLREGLSMKRNGRFPPE